MKNLELKPAIQFELKELAELLTRSFEKYFVPVSFTPALFAAMLRLDGIDLNTSRVIMLDEKPSGCALLAHRGWTTRLAAMGLVAEARGSGIGKWAMSQLIRESNERGDRAMTLEVIEQNVAGVKLYQGSRFETQRRLIGFHGENPVGQSALQLEEVDIRQIARVLSVCGPADLPWQASAATLAQMGRPSCGFRLGSAYAAISNPNEPRIAIRSLVVEEGEQRQGQATKLLRALFARYPQKRWAVSVIWPEEIAPGLFEKLGFEREKITQFQMRLDF